MSETLCQGVTEQQVEVCEARGWMESAMRLNDKDGNPFYRAGFAKGALSLYQQDDLWILSTSDYTIARLQGSVVACVDVAERILRLTDWAAVNQAAQRSESVPAGLADRVEAAICDHDPDASGYLEMPTGPRSAVLLAPDAA